MRNSITVSLIVAGSAILATACSGNDADHLQDEARKPELETIQATEDGVVTRGTAANERLIGTDLADVLSGMGGNDEFIGRTGSDVLIGGLGDDMYLFSPGDGMDVVRDAGGVDEIRLEDGISLADISVLEDSAGLRIEVGETGANDGILIAGWGWRDNYIEKVIVGGRGFDHRQIEGMIKGNRRPQVEIPLTDQTAIVGEKFAYQVPDGTFIDPDPEDTLNLVEYVVGGGPIPRWLTFDPDMARFSGTPSANDIGDFVMEVRAFDPGFRMAAGSFRITVLADGP